MKTWYLVYAEKQTLENNYKMYVGRTTSTEDVRYLLNEPEVEGFKCFIQEVTDDRTRILKKLSDLEGASQ